MSKGTRSFSKTKQKLKIFLRKLKFCENIAEVNPKVNRNVIKVIAMPMGNECAMICLAMF